MSGFTEQEKAASMDLFDYKTGSPLRLDVYDDNGKLIDRDFTSQFEEAVDAYDAYIASPIVEGVVYAVRVGWKITVYMQQGNDFYRFFARVTERMLENGRPLIRVLRVSEIDVAQRRQYYRFKCAIPFKYRLLTKERKSVDLPFEDGSTADISGSGIRFRTGESLKTNSFIECELDIDGKQIFLIGKIVRCDAVEGDSELFAYDVGVLFSEIEGRQREMIIRFIFDEERRLIRQRLA